MTETFIYGICDGNNELLYIGKSNDVDRRFKEHLYAINNSNSIKYKNLSKHEQLFIFIIDIVSIDDWGIWEQFYVDYFKFLGCRLYNIMLMGNSSSYTKVERIPKKEYKFPSIKNYNAAEIKERLIELNISLKFFLKRAGIEKYQFNEYVENKQQPTSAVFHRMNKIIKGMESDKIRMKKSIEKIIKQL